MPSDYTLSRSLYKKQKAFHHYYLTLAYIFSFCVPSSSKSSQPSMPTFSYKHQVDVQKVESPFGLQQKHHHHRHQLNSQVTTFNCHAYTLLCTLVCGNGNVSSWSCYYCVTNDALLGYHNFSRINFWWLLEHDFSSVQLLLRWWW